MADSEARVGEAETQLAMAREKLAWAEAQAGAALTQKEQEWEARMDSATSGAHQEVPGDVLVTFLWVLVFVSR